MNNHLSKIKHFFLSLSFSRIFSLQISQLRKVIISFEFLEAPPKKKKRKKKKRKQLKACRDRREKNERKLGTKSFLRFGHKYPIATFFSFFLV